MTMVVKMTINDHNDDQSVSSHNNDAVSSGDDDRIGSNDSSVDIGNSDGDIMTMIDRLIFLTFNTRAVSHALKSKMKAKD